MLRRTLLKLLAAGPLAADLVAATEAQRHGDSDGPRDRLRPKALIEARDGARLFYQSCGSGHPMLFVAPWALNSEWWEHQISWLAGQGVRCISYDRRGHGRSECPSGGYDFDTLAQDLAAVIEQLHL